MIGPTVDEDAVIYQRNVYLGVAEPMTIYLPKGTAAGVSTPFVVDVRGTAPGMLATQ